MTVNTGYLIDEVELTEWMECLEKPSESEDTVVWVNKVEWLVEKEMDMPELVEVTKEVLVEIVDWTMWSSKLVYWWMNSSYKVPADVH